MTIAILATGDEIVHGDTLNTNGQLIAKALSSEGLPLGLHLTCADKEEALCESIRFLAAQHNIIISIGGLGPTSDDLTRFVFAKVFALGLQEYPEALAHIEARLHRANLPFDGGNRQQALFPPETTLLPNPNGTAMGCIFLAQDILCIFLPGPPRECLPMFEQYVLPRLQETQRSQKQLLSWQLFGVAEGQVAAQLEEALAGLGCKLGYRLDMPYLEFKVFCTSSQVDQVKALVDPLVAAHIISLPKQKASQQLRQRLRTLPYRLVINDQATGGMLESLLRHPETNDFINFQASNRDEELSDPGPTYTGLVIEIKGLKEYWQGQEKNQTELWIHYNLNNTLPSLAGGRRAGDEGVQKNPLMGFEHHIIPYRNSGYILGWAAEWLSFRILHLINTFHDRIG